MSQHIFLSAFVLGLTMTLIPCPIMMIILINTTLKIGKKAAIIVILSTVFFDTFLGIIGALGFNNSIFTEYGRVLDVFSGLLFIWIAYNELRHSSDSKEKAQEELSLKKLFMQVGLLKFFSPIAFSCWISTFSINTATELSPHNALMIICASVAGSSLAWSSITLILLRLQTQFSDKWLSVMRYVTSVILGIFSTMTIVGI